MIDVRRRACGQTVSARTRMPEHNLDLRTRRRPRTCTCTCQALSTYHVHVHVHKLQCMCMCISLHLCMYCQGKARRYIDTSLPRWSRSIKRLAYVPATAKDALAAPVPVALWRAPMDGHGGPERIRNRVSSDPMDGW